MKKYFPVIAVACFSLAVTAPAQAGLVEFFFPMLKDTGPDPAQTLVAPFAEQTPSAKSGAEAQPLPENKVPLDHPHRNSKQIGEWLTMAASEALTFETDNYQDGIGRASRHFDDGGKQQYLEFLQSSNIINNLQSNRYYLRSFVQEDPVLLNEGAIEGRYRWLFQVPVMISYMDRTMRGYKNTQPVSQKISLAIQIGRTADQSPGHDVVIERWSGKILDNAPK